MSGCVHIIIKLSVIETRTITGLDNKKHQGTNYKMHYIYIYIQEVGVTIKL